MYPSLSSNVAGKSIMSSDDRKHIEHLHSYTVCVYIYILIIYIYVYIYIYRLDFQFPCLIAKWYMRLVIWIMFTPSCPRNAATQRQSQFLHYPCSYLLILLHMTCIHHNKDPGLVVDEIDNLVCTLFMLETSVVKKHAARTLINTTVQESCPWYFQFHSNKLEIIGQPKGSDFSRLQVFTF